MIFDNIRTPARCNCCGTELSRNNRVKSSSIEICKDCVSRIRENGLEVTDLTIFSIEQINAFIDNTIPARKKLDAFRVMDSPMALSRGEYCYYAGVANGGKIKNRVVGYQGGSSGVSLHIAKGVSYRVGATKATPVHQDVLETSAAGYFVMTNKRFALLTDRYGFDLKIEKVQSVNAEDGYIQFFSAGKDNILVSSDTRKIAKIMQLILTALKENVESTHAINGISADKGIDGGGGKSPKKSAGAASSEDIVKQLENYKKLLNSGILSEEEFAQLKKNLLGL